MGASIDFAEIQEEYGTVRYPLLHFVREYLLRYPGRVALNRGAHVIRSTLMVIPPYLLGLATDILISEPAEISILLLPNAWEPSTRIDQFLLIVGILATVVLGIALMKFIEMRSEGFLREWPSHDVRADAYAATQRLGLEFFDNAQTGDVMSVLSNDLRSYTGIYGGLLQNLTGWIVTTALGLAVMFALNWQFTLILVILLTPVGLIARHVDDRIAPQYQQVMTYAGQLNARIENSISGIGTVKATTNEAYERERVETTSAKNRDANWEAAKTKALFIPLTGASTSVATVVAFVLGAWWAVFGPPFAVLAPMTVGAFVTFFFYMRGFSESIGRIVQYIDQYRNFEAAANRIHGLMAHPGTVPEATEPIELEGLAGRVSYDGVTFRYPGTDEPALEDVELTVAPGEYIGIVGPTGAGKTTLLKLLVRFYDPDEGTIRVDGHDLRDVGLRSLRERIGYVSQEPFLFDDTVAENIAYANPDADETAIKRAAKRANADEFIVQLDDGYDTLVGERGIKLSGGQRQRIAIARAILKDPDILILDEATSHVDNETELLIQQALAELIAGRTTFAIAHSLATVRDANELLVLEDGRIRERGSHEELVAAGGLYATLWGVHVGEVTTPTDHMGDGIDG